jgi:hypothetical protein
LTTKRSPQRPCVRVGQRCAEGCHTTAKTAVQGMLCGRHKPSSVSVGLLPKDLMWIFITVLIHLPATVQDSSYQLLLTRSTHLFI